MLQLRGQLGPRRLVVLRRLRQQEARFQVSEPGRHDEVVGRDLEVQKALPRDEGEILVRERQDRDLPEIDLLLARQSQQQIDRTLIPVEFEHQLLGARRGASAHVAWPVIIKTKLYSASAGTPTIHPSTLRLRPVRSPT